MPAVNDVGEPCAGEPHARFDGRELETEQALVTDTEKNAPVGNHPATAAPRPTAKNCHRASSRPYVGDSPTWCVERPEGALTSEDRDC
jgi:hypothetical protein